MKATKLDEITKIEQSSIKEEVNEFLAKGYRIIKIFSTKRKVGEDEIIEPCYVLGLIKE